MPRPPMRATLDVMPLDIRPHEGPLAVLVAGAGIAGLETMVALRGLAPDAVAPTLVAPEEAFALRAQIGRASCRERV